MVKNLRSYEKKGERTKGRIIFEEKSDLKRTIKKKTSRGFKEKEEEIKI